MPQPRAHTSSTEARARVRRFVDVGLCQQHGDAPASWGMIVARAAQFLPGIPAAAVALTLQEDYPEMHAAIVAAHGRFGRPRGLA